MQEKNIVANNLYNYLQQVVEATKEGYELSELNVHFPQNLTPSLFTCTMVKEETWEPMPIINVDEIEKKIVEVAEQPQQVEEQTKVVRKRNVKT